MSEASERYHQLMSDLLNAREVLGGVLSTESESERAAALEECWWQMTEEEQEEQEECWGCRHG